MSRVDEVRDLLALMVANDIVAMKVDGIELVRREPPPAQMVPVGTASREKTALDDLPDSLAAYRDMDLYGGTPPSDLPIHRTADDEREGTPMP